MLLPDDTRLGFSDFKPIAPSPNLKTPWAVVDKSPSLIPFPISYPPSATYEPDIA